MKIGIFGGSFNPVHRMHVNIVRSLIKKGYVDKVIIVPTGDDYQKSHKLPGVDRVNMISEIFKKDDNVEVSSYEVDGHLFTINTLKHFQKMNPKDELFFILGTDLLAEFNTWYKYQNILNEFKLLVVSRDTNDFHKEIKKYKKYEDRIIQANISPKIISSTQIRNEIKNKVYKEDLKELLYVSTIDYLKTINVKKYWK